MKSGEDENKLVVWIFIFIFLSLSKFSSGNKVPELSFKLPNHSLSRIFIRDVLNISEWSIHEQYYREIPKST